MTIIVRRCGDSTTVPLLTDVRLGFDHCAVDDDDEGDRGATLLLPLDDDDDDDDDDGDNEVVDCSTDGSVDNTVVGPSAESFTSPLL
jgi:hypothetical protein